MGEDRRLSKKHTFKTHKSGEFHTDWSLWKGERGLCSSANASSLRNGLHLRPTFWITLHPCHLCGMWVCDTVLLWSISASWSGTAETEGLYLGDGTGLSSLFLPALGLHLWNWDIQTICWKKKKKKVFWHSYLVLIVLNVHNVQWEHLKFTNNFALTECLFWQINNLWQTINYISFTVTFCSGWAHPLKWARNKEFSAGRKIGCQPSSESLSLGWVSIKTKDMISNPYWSWICPAGCQESRLSPKIQSGCSGSPLYPFLSEHFAARQGCCAGIAVTSCILLWLPRPHRSPLPAKALGQSCL